MANFYKNDRDKPFRLVGNVSPEALIFAEGSTEALFLDKWMESAGYDDADVAVFCFKGHESLPTSFRRLMEDENFNKLSKIGFLVDSEKLSAQRRTNLIKKVLVDNGRVGEGDMLVPGEILISNEVKYVVHVCPNNLSNGLIEDNIIEELKHTAFWPALESFSDATAVMNGRPTHQKTVVQAYISARDPRLCGSGRAFSAGILDVNHNAYESIRTTISNLLA